nr:putative ribonuclease H-like domain-containing protein [Tanacetum cinerariifolium]
MNELEQVKKEKEGLDNKLTSFESALKDLDTLLRSQRTDKNKEGLPEFVDDTVTDYSRPTPSIDSLKSNTSDLQNSNSSVSKHGESSSSIMSKPMIMFVKAVDCPKVFKTNNTKNARKSPMKYTEMYRNISKGQLRDKIGRFNEKVIEFGDSYKAPQEETGKGPASENSAKKKGRTVVITIKDMQKRRNDFKARTTMLLAHPNEHQLRFSKNRDDLDTMSLDDVYNHLKVYELEVQKKSDSNSQNMAFISSSNTSNGKGKVHTASVPTASTQVSTASTDIVAASISHDTAILLGSVEHLEVKIESYMTNEEENHALVADDEALTEFALMAKSSSSFENEVKKEKGCLDNKLTGFEYALKDLDTLLGSQRTDKNKEGLGYSAVPPAQVYSPPKKDLSWTRLPEFVDDTVTDYSRPTHSIDSSKSNTIDLQNSSSSVSEHGESSSSIMSKPMIKFVKAADCRGVIKTNKTKTARKSPVKYAEIYRNTSKSPKVKGYWDSGCYQHMTGNISYLSEYEPYDGGYVSFGQGRGKITGKDHLGKFDAKGDEGYFVRYSMSSKAFRVFNKRTKKVEENLHVDFLKNKLVEKRAGPNWLFDIDTLTNSMNYVPVVVAGTSSTNISGTKDVASKAVSSLRYIALLNWFHEAYMESYNNDAQDACNDDVPESSGISNPTATSKIPPADQMESLTVESEIPTEEPNKIFDALKDPSWVEAMHEELLQFKIQNVWIDPEFPDRVYKVEKAMYGLHQAPKAWYGTLSKYLLNNGFQRGTIDQTLFIRKHKGEFLLVQVYVDDIIFGSSNLQLCREFKALMHDKFQMSAMGELTFFLGLQVLQKKMAFFSHKTSMLGNDGPGKDVELHLYRSMIRSLMYLTASRPDIMFAVCAFARHQVTPKECHFHVVKRIFRYLKGHPKLGLWYLKESPFDLVAYSDSDYGGATQDRKSTTGGCQFLGRRLISLQCKKQTIVATSTTEAEYIAAASGYGQVLWIQNQMLDYGFLEASHIRYALTISPTVYVLHIRQFWSTARIKTTNEETKILATVDGKPRTISESSLMRHLKLNDEEGISSLPDTELFENLLLMGYNILQNQRFTFQKGQFSHRWKFFIHTIMQCLGLKSTGFNEFSSNIATAVDRENINKTSALPHESSPRVTSLDADEGKVKFLEDKDRGRPDPSQEDASIKGGSMEIKEEVRVERSTELGSNDTEEMVNVLSSMEAVNILTSGVAVVSVSPVAAATTVGVPTVSGRFPTVSAIFTTASMVTPYSRRPIGISAKDKGKEKVVESEVPKKRKFQEQIDAQVAREIEEDFARENQRLSEQLIELINELVKYQDHHAKILKYQAQQSKPLSKKEQREFYMSVLESHAGWKTKHFKGMTLEEIKEKFIPVWKQLEDFVPMSSKEESKRVERQGSSKRMKTSKNAFEGVSKEELKEMMQLVPLEEVYVEAQQLWILVKETLSIKQAKKDKENELWVELKRLFEPDLEDQLWTHNQNFMHDPLEWRLYDTCGVHHVFTKIKRYSCW